MLLLKGIIELYKQGRKRVYACFVDFKAAFDNVWHAGLICKLRKYGLSSNVIALLSSMYNNLKTCVKVGPFISKKFNCVVGTRQGCCLSPVLFKMYIDDLYQIFNGKKTVI